MALRNMDEPGYNANGDWAEEASAEEKAERLRREVASLEARKRELERHLWDLSRQVAVDQVDVARQTTQTTPAGLTQAYWVPFRGFLSWDDALVFLPAVLSPGGEFMWSDKRASGARKPRLLLRRAGELREFSGGHVAGWLVVLSDQFYKAGKWSFSKWVLRVGDAVSVLPLPPATDLLSGLTELCGEHAWSWSTVAEVLGVPVPEVKTFVRANCRSSAQTLDERALATNSLGS
jgi:hypothetical protein